MKNKKLVNAALVLGISTLVLFGCSNENKEPNKEPKEEVSVENENKEETKKLDLNEERAFIIDEGLQSIYESSLKNEEVVYDYIDSINFKDKVISLNAIIESKDFNKSMEKLTSAISLSYSIAKLDTRDIKNIEMDIYNEKGEFLHTSTIEIDKLKTVLSSLANGINGATQYSLYETSNLLPVIEKLFPENYQTIVELKEHSDDVEIMRNKGETDEVLKNAELYNLDKITNNSFRTMITEANVSLKNIDLNENTISGDTYINLNEKAESELQKVVESVTILYAFVDFKTNIDTMQLTVYSSDNKKLETFTIKVSDFEQLVKDIAEIKDKSELSKKIDAVLNLENLTKNFTK